MGEVYLVQDRGWGDVWGCGESTVDSFGKGWGLAPQGLCVCVCVCVWMCVCEWMCVCVCVCVCVCECVWMCVCEWMCVCVLDRESESERA